MRKELVIPQFIISKTSEKKYNKTQGIIYVKLNITTFCENLTKHDSRAKQPISLTKSIMLNK
jgi:hypothetical protein